MAARGIGMPCGIVARFPHTGGDRVEAALEKAKQRFPLLGRRVSWINSRPMLVAANSADQTAQAATTSSLLDSHCTHWRHRILQCGSDAWLMAIWPHAMADGPSMLRFLETIGAIINEQPLLPFRYGSHHHQAHHQPMARWLLSFFINQKLRYVHVGQRGLLPGVAWLTLPGDYAMRLVERSRVERMNTTAWLAAATCMAVCQQQGITKGRVLLNVQVQRGSLEQVGGFGFAAGSMLMPVKFFTGIALPTLARTIFDRLMSMINQGWNDNFERFLGGSPQRHRRFAMLNARGRPAPIVSVSWKGRYWNLGGENTIRDAACFAVSPTLHVSGHIDQTGMSLSVTSKQSTTERQDLLRRLVLTLCGSTAERILTFDGHAVEAVPSATCDEPYVMGDLQSHSRASSAASDRA